MRIAITGGRGFIGSATTDEAIRRGHTVVAIDHHNGIDVQSKEAFKIIQDSDTVIHLAGILGTGELFENPYEAVDVNVNGALRVLQACEQGTRYVSITMPDVWRNPYQATKRCARDLASAWHQHRGVEVSHVRAYNVYGPGQKYGKPQKIIPTFSVKAWVGRPIPIWGDGYQTVDLVHVDDVARMLVDVAERPGHDEIFEAGTGYATSVNQVAQYVLNVVGRDYDDRPGPGQTVEHLAMRPGETPSTPVVATGSGWTELGWHPSFHLGRFNESVQAYESVALDLAETLV